MKRKSHTKVASILFAIYVVINLSNFKKEIEIDDLLSSSSYRAGSTDIPDPLSPLLPIVHRPR